MTPRRPLAAWMILARLALAGAGLALGGGSARAAERPPVAVTFLAPNSAQPIFWQVFAAFLHQAAADFGMALEVLYADDEAGVNRRQFDEILARPNRPDYLLFKPYKNNASYFIERADKAGLPILAVNARAYSAEAPLGAPRERFRHWLGEMYADDELAGYDLARLLIERAEARGLRTPDGRLPMAGLTGPAGDGAAEARVIGLERAVAEAKDVVLQRVTRIERWDGPAAGARTLELLTRFPETGVLWAGADGLALAAAGRVPEIGHRPGQTLIVGGITGLGPGLNGVIDGVLEVTYGGHVAEGAWCLALIHDHAGGRDFAGEAVTFKTRLIPITKAEAPRYRDLLALAQPEAVDFRRYSKLENPGRQRYDFSLSALLAALPKAGKAPAPAKDAAP